MVRKNKKQTNNLLKGMAAAGAVVGGGGIIQGNNVVYAAENEDETLIGSASESAEILSTSESGIQFVSEKEQTESESTSNSINSAESEVVKELDSTSVAQSENISISESISTSELAKPSLSTSESIVLSESLSLETSTYTSESEVASNVYSMASENYQIATEEERYLETLIVQIEKYEAQMNSYLTQCKADNPSNPNFNSYYNVNNTDGTSAGYRNFWRIGDDLTIKLAEYKFFQQFGKGEITKTGTWVSSSTFNNNVYLEYTTYADYDTKTGPIVHKGYFDYVEGYLDSNGNMITYRDQSDNPSSEAKKNANDIIILQKAIKYESKESNATFYEDTQLVNGKLTTVYKFSVKGKAQNVNTITYTNNGVVIDSGDETYYLSETKEFAPVTNLYNLYIKAEYGTGTTNKGTVFTSIHEFEERKTPHDEKRKEFTSVSESQNALKSTSISTSNSIKESQSNSSKLESESIKNSLAGSESNSRSLQDEKDAATSTSISLSELKSQQIIDSQSTSQSIQISESVSESLKHAGSMNKSDSASNSTSTSTSLSTSTSESYATSVLTSTYGGEIVYREVVVDTSPVPLMVARADSVTDEEELIASNDEEELISTEETIDETEEEIEDEITPMASLAAKVWWSWIPIMGTLASIKETHDERKDKKKEEDNKD